MMLLAFLALVVQATPAKPATAAATAATPNDGDLRCIAISSKALAQAPQEKQLSVVAGMLYFVGRINGRSPKADIEAGVRRITPSLDNETTWQAEAKRCAAIMQDRAAYLQKMGRALQSP